MTKHKMRHQHSLKFAVGPAVQRIMLFLRTSTEELRMIIPDSGMLPETEALHVEMIASRHEDVNTILVTIETVATVTTVTMTTAIAMTTVVITTAVVSTIVVMMKNIMSKIDTETLHLIIIVIIIIVMIVIMVDTAETEAAVTMTTETVDMTTVTMTTATVDINGDEELLTVGEWMDGLISWTDGREISPTLTVFVTTERR